MEDFEQVDGLGIWLKSQGLLKADGSLKEHVVYSFEYCGVFYAATLESGDKITLIREDMGQITRMLFNPVDRKNPTPQEQCAAAHWVIGEVSEHLTDMAVYDCRLSELSTRRAMAHKAKRLEMAQRGEDGRNELTELYTKFFATPIADQ